MTRRVLGGKLYCRRGEHWVLEHRFKIRENGRPHSWCETCKADYDRIKQQEQRDKKKLNASKIKAG